MRTARHIALAAALAVPVFGLVACPDACTDWDCLLGEHECIGEDEARAVLSGLIEMANEAKRGTHTYTCPFGGEATNTVTVTSQQLGDSGLYSFGKWELNASECGLAVGYPDLATDVGGEFRVHSHRFDSGRRRFKAWVEWGVSGSTPDGYFGCGSEGLSKAFWKESGDDGPFTPDPAIPT